MNSLFNIDLNPAGLPFTMIKNVGPVPGGDAFLLKNESTAILFDAGFGCGGEKLVQNLIAELNGQKLDYILLSHSHYDHAPGSAWCKQQWPECQIIASRKTQSVFSRPGAIRTMRKLDQAAAEQFNIHSDKDYFDQLKVDIAMDDGDSILLHDLKVQGLLQPGHTNCSMGYWFPDYGLLLESETPGVYVEGSSFVISALLTGFQNGLSVIEDCISMPIKHLLIPHCGLIHGEDCKTFFIKSKEMNIHIQERINQAIELGMTREEMRLLLKEMLYRDEARKIQPEAAFDENSGYIIDTLIKEYKARSH